MGYHGPGGGASASAVARRTSPCFALSYASIPYVLWGEDSLCFAFNVPTELFETVYILVPGTRLHDASSAIINRLPYRLSPDRHHRLSSSSDTAYLPECLRLDCIKPLSPCPRQILLISDHLLHFDTTDPQSMQKLHLEQYRPAGVNEGDWILVPTLPAYLDFLLSCNRELFYWRPAPLGWWQWFWGRTKDEEGLKQCRTLGSHISVTLAYLLMYTFNRDAKLYPNVESIAESVKKVTALLREENREDFLKNFVGVDPPLGDDPWEQGFESSDSDEEEGEGELEVAMKGEEKEEANMEDEGKVTRMRVPRRQDGWRWVRKTVSERCECAAGGVIWERSRIGRIDRNL